MNSVTVGVAIAAAVAGWPLYTMVTTGSLGVEGALVRGGVVAGGCIVGVTLVARLATSYEAEAETARRRKLNSLFSDMEGAVANGTLKPESDDPPPRTP